jgi:hypothetical protein
LLKSRIFSKENPCDLNYNNEHKDEEKLVAILFWFVSQNCVSVGRSKTEGAIVSLSVKCLKNYSQIDIRLNGCGNVLSLNFNILIASLGNIIVLFCGGDI